MILDFFRNITWGQPLFLWLLVVIPLIIAWKMRWGKRLSASLSVSSTRGLEGTKTIKSVLRPLPFVLRLLAVACLILALARPQFQFEEQERTGEGIDIVLCIDVSGSMTARDFSPNRMEAAKSVALDFVDSRPNDRIAVVIFAGESFTQAPLTTDHFIVKSQIEQIRNGLLEDGTSIGSGLATSVDRLRESKTKSKVVILLTDGVNNGGLIDPATAREIAKVYGVKVYTIGVGTEGYAPTPVSTPLGVVMQNEKVTIDEELLKDIAAETGGRYFRATDNESLEKIYEEIDRLEKSEVQITTFSRSTEKFHAFLLAALLFLFVESILKFVVLKKFP